jgi:hypothetical protein
MSRRGWRRSQRAHDQRAILRRIIQQLRGSGIAIDVITGAGTGTYDRVAGRFLPLH